jgi:hypothetical protein
MEPNYQNEPPQGSGYQRQEPLPNATTILVLGILSIPTCQLLGIAALIMANNSLALYHQAPERYTLGSYNNVKAGKICGIIGICLLALVICLWIAGVGIFSFMAVRHNGMY